MECGKSLKIICTYIKKKLAQVKPNDFDSSFWKGILRANDDFFGRGHFKLVMAWKLDFGKTHGLETHL
jgi:hypothetical protein